MAEIEHYTIQDVGGKALHGVLWRSEGPTRGVIQFVHGIGEHAACYHRWVQGFCAAGYSCAGVDHRGHGSSPGKRGHTTATLFESDMELALKYTRSLFPEVPVFLYGHSMGAALTLSFAFRHRSVPLTGVIASSPMLGLVRYPNPFWRYLSGFFAWITPDITLGTGIRREELSSDVSLVKSTKTDPLMHKRISVRLIYDLFRVARELLLLRDPFPCPLLLMHGTSDPVCSVEAVRCFASFRGPETTLKLWAQKLHELHREPGSRAMQVFIIHWLDEQIDHGTHV